jgi:transcriptional regulator with XRE-family HTH domain
MVSAAQIRAARALLGWSRERLAREAGVTEAEIAAIEDREAIGGGPFCSIVRKTTR